MNNSSRENKLFRMSFILQDSNVTTVEKHLVKIIEAVIFNSEKESMSIPEIREGIMDGLGLEFEDDEIRHAILCGKHNNFILAEKAEVRISLTPSCIINYAKKGSYSSELRRYAYNAINELGLDIKTDELSELLTDYFYFVFNSNKDAILALVRKKETVADDGGYDKKSSDEKRIITAFLEWDNDEKNKFIYNLISYCYVYCSITVRKDDMLGKTLFRGKKFFLDANIIFRLAGINNDSRKFSTSSFEKKSRDLGIELCYTNYTFDELQRVIRSRVSWISGVTGGTEPIDTSQYEDKENDFFRLYYEWCKDNDYQDLTAFQTYLTHLVYSVIDKYKKYTIPSYVNTQKDEINTQKESLRDYKLQRVCKKQTDASLITDVCNLKYVEEQRKETIGNLWSINHYFISADKNLISWSSVNQTGEIPIVVLPSVWLTIMLRFTSRTTDDYKAFCSFMQLRTDVSNNGFDVYKLLESLAVKTNNKEVKERIVQEVYQNINRYDIGDYNKVAEMAFDTILQEKDEKEKNELLEINRQIAKETHARKEEEKKRENDRDRIIERLNKQVEKDMQVINIKYNISIGVIWMAYAILWVMFICFVISAIKGIGLGYEFVVQAFPNISDNYSDMISLLAIITTLMIGVLTPLAAVVKKISDYFFGEDRRRKQKERIRSKYMGIIDS